MGGNRTFTELIPKDCPASGGRRRSSGCRVERETLRSSGRDRASCAKLLEALHEEFDETHPPETIDQIMADSRSRFESIAAVEQFVPVLAHRLARERLQALARVAGKLPRERPEVLFVGLEGRGRSQIAASLFNLRAGGRINASTAGTHASALADENVKAAMREVGIDLEDIYPMPLTDEALAGADVIVTLGRSVGPVRIPEDTRHEDWRIGDPVGAPLEEVRRIRDEINRRV
jgi:arsenate reductase (thioredoxin)